jgi:FixJ family two-component response regulator
MTQLAPDDPPPVVYVADDDPAVRVALAAVGPVLGWPVKTFDSAAAFLDGYDPEATGCLVLDVRMPGMSGPELQRKLADDGCDVPIVMISGHADVRTAVEAMTLGAVTLLEKPFGLDELLAHVRKAVAKDQEQRAERTRRAATTTRLAALTPKEREVLDLIAAGKTNREMAEVLGLSVRAVEDRRARLMKKAGVRSVAELVRALTLP